MRCGAVHRTTAERKREQETAIRTAIMLGLVGLFVAAGAALFMWRTLQPLLVLRLRARQVAADGLLQYMATFDFEGSLFGAPLLEVATRNRAQHVESLRFFREEAVAEQYPTLNPDWDFYVGRWAGVYVELRVVRATGAFAECYFEID